MVKLRILLPDATVNYIKNPAMRYDTTDWNAQGSTVTRTLTRARFGIASLKVVSNGAALNEGAYFRVSALSGISDSITVSAYVRGTGKVRIRLDDNGPGGNEYASTAVQLTDERWTRIEVTGRSTGGNDLRLYVETAEGVAKSRTFYVDGAQMERKSYATTYCDGEQEGCRWTGVYHASTSSRPASTRAGGRWVQLAGEEREAEDLYMTVAGGLGVAPLTNNIQTFALAAGGYHQNVKVNMRPITLSFHAKHANFFRENPVSLERLHELRQMLIDAVKPDLTAGDEDIWFEYTDGPIPLYFRARYDGGLEGDWDVRNQWVNSFPLRLLAVSPFFEEDSQEAQELDFQDTLYPNYIAGRIDGRWSTLNYGFDSTVNRFVKGPRGEIYAVGGFSVVNNNAAALDPLRTARGVAYWDGEKWVPMVTLGGSTQVIGMDVAPNGYVYVTGTFTSINGVAASRVAYWNGTTWNAMGAGLTKTAGTPEGWAVRCAPNGDVYVGGDFDGAGGNTCYNIARWDGGSWHQLGANRGLNNDVFAIEISRDASLLYVGGQFTDQQGLAANALPAVAQYDIAGGVFSAMGSGFSWSGGGVVNIQDIRLNTKNRLFASGTFDASGSTDVFGVAEWNGNQWLDIGSGFDESVSATTVNGMGEQRDGSMIFVGPDFTGTIDLRGPALLTGSSFVALDAYTKLLGWVEAMSNNDSNDIFCGIGNQTAATSWLKCSGITQVTNPGSAEANPIFYIKGPGTLRWIENQTTMKRLFFDLDILANEEIVIDTGKGTITSSLRTSLLYKLLNGSDFVNFVLAPGDNTLACLLLNDTGAQMSLRHTPLHWSADATGRGDTL